MNHGDLVVVGPSTHQSDLYQVLTPTNKWFVAIALGLILVERSLSLQPGTHQFGYIFQCLEHFSGHSTNVVEVTGQLRFVIGDFDAVFSHVGHDLSYMFQFQSSRKHPGNRHLWWGYYKCAVLVLSFKKTRQVPSNWLYRWPSADIWEHVFSFGIQKKTNGNWHACIVHLQMHT